MIFDSGLLFGPPSICGIGPNSYIPTTYGSYYRTLI